MCSLWGVDFNALTLINLIAAIGISVEFTAHTTRTDLQDFFSFFNLIIFFFFMRKLKFQYCCHSFILKK